MVFEFGDFELDESLFELRRRGLRASVQPKVLKLLLYLVQHRDRVVGKEELIRLLWPTESVGETSLTRAVRGARLALGDSGESQRAIKTVRGGGYRFALSARERQKRQPATAASGPGAGEVTTTVSSLFPSPAEIFVGREAPMEILEGALNAARAGGGKMVLLVGEPGIGKTRLVRHFSARARHIGAMPLLGRCVEGEGAPAYWPWLGIVRQYVEQHDGERVRALMGAGADDIAQALPELNRWLSGLATPPVISSTQARFRFYDSMVAFFRRAAAEQPLVLIFDDLQRADQPTVRLLQFLSRELEDMHLLVVGTHRPLDAMPQRVGEMLSELVQRSSSRCVQLEGFSRKELTRYLEQTLVAPAPPALVESLHEQTAGNPLFFSQIVDIWRAAGPAAPRTNWDFRQLSRECGLQEAIQRRVEALSGPCCNVLSTAAVIGHEFSLGALAATTQAPTDELLLLLGEAIRAGIVSASTAAVGRYRFVHGLLPDALYGRLSTLEVARLHQRVGTALEKLCGADVEPHLAELAHHFLLGAPVGDVDKAVDYSLRAADRAMAQLAHEEAAMHFDRALQALALRPADEARMMETLAGKGEALFAANDLEGSRAAFERSAAIARKVASSEGLARAACGIAMPRELGRVDEARIAVLEEAIGVLPVDHALHPMLLAFLAKALLYAGELERRVALAREAVIRARPLRTTRPVLFGQVLRIAHGALGGPEHSGERRRMNEELIALAVAEHNDELLLSGHHSDVQNFLELGDMKSVDAAVRAMVTLAERTRQPHYRMFGEVFAAMRALTDGRFAEAESHAREALAQGKRMDPDAAYHVYCVQLNGILSLQGRLDEQEALVRDISSRYPGLGGWRSVLGCVEARRGMWRQARQRFERLMAGLADAIRVEPFVLGLLAPLADLCSAVGDADHAVQLYQALAPYTRYYGIIVSGLATQGPVVRHMALMAAQMGRHELAAAHFEAALSTTDGGSRPHLALASHEYARLLASTENASNRARARELLERARSEGDALGMAGLVKDCEALAADLGAGPSGVARRAHVRQVLS